MKLSSLLNAPLTGYYLLIVKLKTMWYFRTMNKRKKNVEKFLRSKFEAEGLKKKFVDTVISNYVDIGSALLDRELIQKALMLRRQVIVENSE